MKPGSVGPPEIYLGGHMRNITLENGAKARCFKSLQYVQSDPSKSLTPIQNLYGKENYFDRGGGFKEMKLLIL